MLFVPRHPPEPQALEPSGLDRNMQESKYFREQAQECRAAAAHAQSQQDARALRQLASYYEKEASRLEVGVLKVMH